MIIERAFFVVMAFIAILGMGCWIAKWEADRWGKKNLRRRHLPQPESDERSSLLQFRRMNRRR